MLQISDVFYLLVHHFLSLLSVAFLALAVLSLLPPDLEVPFIVELESKMLESPNYCLIHREGYYLQEQLLSN